MHSDRYHLVELANQRAIELAKKSNDDSLVEVISSSFKQLRRKGQKLSAQAANAKE
jgi:hypothetical protein